jgi:hypothetical protein
VGGVAREATIFSPGCFGISLAVSCVRLILVAAVGQTPSDLSDPMAAMCSVEVMQDHERAAARNRNNAKAKQT